MPFRHSPSRSSLMHLTNAAKIATDLVDFFRRPMDKLPYNKASYENREDIETPL